LHQEASSSRQPGDENNQLNFEEEVHFAQAWQRVVCEIDQAMRFWHGAGGDINHATEGEGFQSARAMQGEADHIDVGLAQHMRGHKKISNNGEALEELMALAKVLESEYLHDLNSNDDDQQMPELVASLAKQFRVHEASQAEQVRG
jgi:hypothetical protein